MRSSPAAQRELKLTWAEHIASDLDPERLGVLTVSLRNDRYWIIDGQHRVEAMRLAGWADQSIQCWVYEGLTETQEAELFLRLNDVLPVSAHAKQGIGVTAGRAEECEIDRVVRAQGLCISQDKLPGAVRCPGTLRRIIRRSDSVVLGRTLRIIRDAYGDAGFESTVIDGLAYLCARYNGELVETTAVA
jgi:hypothetical protein